MVSSFDIANIAFSIAVLAVYVYAAYNAFGIRHTFSVGLYRHQALGVGLIATIYAVNFLNNFVFSYVPPNNPTSLLYTNLGPAGVPIYFTYFFVLFYWIDSSVLAARRSDPLLRDTLHWSRIRIVPWILTSVSVGVIVSLFLSFQLFPPPGGPSTQGPPPAFLAPFIIILILGVPVLGILLLPITARRTKDPLLRKQLYWFGLFVLFYLLNPYISMLGSNPAQSLFISYAFHLLSGYCLYRSAKSLVPLYTFDKEKKVVQ